MTPLFTRHLIILIQLFLCFQIHSQCWELVFQNTDVTSFNDVFFNNQDLGWVVGNDGAIYKTTNGGTDWQPKSSGTTNDLTAVWFTDALTGWATGTNATLLETTDGGQTWNIRQLLDYNPQGCSFPDICTPEIPIYSDLFFLDNQTGYITASEPYSLNNTLEDRPEHLFKTTDGGITWDTIIRLQSSWVYFTDDQNGFSVRNLQIFFQGLSANISFTTNGGAGWNVYLPVSQLNTESNYYDMEFTSSSDGWLVGGGSTSNLLLRTTNGGSSWEGNTPIPTTSTLYSIEFPTSQRGWISGDKGTIITTRDGGANWEIQSTPVTNRLYKLAFPNENRGYAVGFGGVILRYTDEGNPPNCDFAITQPADLSTAVSVNETLQWTLPSNCTDSFRIQLGTSIGGGDLLDTMVEGTRTELPLSGILPYETEVFASIDPSNGNGLSDCADIVFTTQIKTCAIRDSLALVDLFNALDGPNWTVDPWDLLQPMDTWAGITTNAEGCVVSVDLPDNGLSGIIPNSIGQLENLQELYLFDNPGISGQIPENIGDLAQLKIAHLYENNFTGSIPASIGDLENLEELFLYRNQLNGSIPSKIGDLKNLQKLLLYENQLSGTIPSSIGELASLKELSLGVNQLSGQIPATIGNLSRLERLWLYTNQLDGNLPSNLGSLSNLQLLSVGTNQLDGSIPETLGNLNNLQELYLYDNQFSGQLPSEFSQLSNLNILELQQNQLSGALPPEWGQLTSLTELQLFENSLEGCFPVEYAVFCGITTDFSNNPSLSGNGNFAAFCSDPNLGMTVVPIETSICEGSSIQIGDRTITEAGIYTDTIEHPLNCDTLKRFQVTVLAKKSETIDTILCPGMPVPDTLFLLAANGCDSTVIFKPTIINGTANAGMDKTSCAYDDKLAATLPPGFTGRWETLGTSAMLIDANDPATMVIELVPGKNRFKWTLSHPNCPDISSDEVTLDFQGESVAANSDTYEYQYDQAPLLVDVGENDELPENNSVEFRITDYQSTPPEYLTLDPQGNLRINIPRSAHNLTYSADYQVQSIACGDVMDKATITVFVSSGSEGVPRVITPGEPKDDVNDVLIIPELVEEPGKYPSNELVIINRWGQVVYYAQPYLNDWDGTHWHTKQPLPAGTYFYIVRLNLGNGEIIKERVTLIR